MPAPLWVRAKPGVCVPVPDNQSGQPMYVGRSIDYEAFANGETDMELLYPILPDATEYSVALQGSLVFNEIKRAVRDGDLLVELQP